jgi:hypothetical protein
MEFEAVMGLFNRRNNTSKPFEAISASERKMLAQMGLTPSDSARELFGWTSADDVSAAISSLRNLQRKLLELRENDCSLREEMEIQIQIQSMRNLIKQSGGIPPDLGEVNYQFSPPSFGTSPEKPEELNRPKNETLNEVPSVNDSEALEEIAQRCSLFLPDYGMTLPDEYFDEVSYYDSIGLRRGLVEGLSASASNCIERFVNIEGNCRDSHLKGLGRILTTSFPRLGGVLSDEVKGDANIETIIKDGVRCTIEAGYFSMLCHSNFKSRKALIYDADTLWEKWIPMSYSVPPNISDFIFDSVAIEMFWKAVFEKAGLKKARAQMESTLKNPLVDSIGGLATTGATLFLAEISG